MPSLSPRAALYLATSAFVAVFEIADEKILLAKPGTENILTIVHTIRRSDGKAELVYQI